MNKSDWNLVGLTCLAFMIGLTFFATITLAYKNDDPLSPTYIISMSMDVVGMVICIILFSTLIFDQRMDMSTIYFMAVIVFECMLLFTEFQSIILDNNPDRIVLNKLSNYYSYGLILMLLVTFWMYLKHLITERDAILTRLETAIYIVFAVGMTIIVTNGYTGFLFIIDEATGSYVRQDMQWLSYLFPMVIVAHLFFVIHRYIAKSRNKLFLYTYLLFPAFVGAIQYVFPHVELLCIAPLFSIALIYGNYYIEKEHEVLEKEAEIEKQKVAMMISQIRPKFLFKSLIAIENIDGIPTETRQAIAKFNKYMFGNFDSLLHQGTIPFEKEIDHVKTYVDLEKLRFKEGLSVEYDIKVNDFEIPTLTLQIIVENAIKHGITQKEGGGTVRIHTEETADAYVVTVIDDGVGYDTSVAPPVDSEKSHVGLVNIKQRVEEICEGTIHIDSKIGKGTEAVITLPKNVRGGGERNPVPLIET